MEKNLLKLLLSLSVLFFFNCKGDDDFTTSTSIDLSENTIIYENDIYDAYTLLSPLGSNNTFLINNEGFVVNKWESNTSALVSYLTDEGNLIRALRQTNTEFESGLTGAIEILNFEGDQIWFWEYNTSNYVLHHDLSLLPNGNILAIVWEYKSANEAIQKGRNPNLLFDNKVWPCKIIEINPLANNQAEIVWQWSVWDHLIQDYDATKENFGVVSNHPELININFSSGDANFNHLNSIAYIEAFDQIVVSSRNFNEFWIIDHSTSTAEAASHLGGNSNKGGDLLYRWGNPIAYNMGTPEDQRLFGQHDVTWLGNTTNNGGNFLVFNNNKYSNKSSIDEILIPQLPNGTYELLPNSINLPETYNWSYENDIIYSSRLSGAKRLPNGNTLITNGRAGTLYEINQLGTIVWQYQNPIETNSSIFKVNKYEKNHPAFDGKDLAPLPIAIE
ncbi:aryl-sulfate sulfotransferase [Oceanihabitans sp. 2_MG-2023]|uniref:aryl-sulfate sulfotransferase n=1 Tax=Oceanihabitans sp. 2_MG-2023 TaxID=3062661 RepID=UPI0026E37955|nr:aryl-sulfate sulfotransferase [Oceanihabitans sp. 2_MG-2023]MDO6596106.1 aryl-sulfate sulfotransferase [Oceanihabitans sp. 2_MG-2023]